MFSQALVGLSNAAGGAELLPGAARNGVADFAVTVCPVGRLRVHADFDEVVRAVAGAMAQLDLGSVLVGTPGAISQ